MSARNQLTRRETGEGRREQQLARLFCRFTLLLSPLALLTPAAQAAVNDWSSRSGGANVPGGAASIVSVQSFDTIAPPNVAGDNWSSGMRDYFQINIPGSVTRDCGVAAEGYAGDCSLKYTLHAGDFQAGPGWYDYNFRPVGDPAGQFGAGQEFYVQYQERIQNMTAPNAYSGVQGNGFKHDLITEADAASYEAHNCDNHPAQFTVIQDDTNAPFPGAFINCGYSGGAYAFMQSGYEAFQIPISGNYLDQVASGCEHYTDPGHTQYPTSDPTCWKYVDSEWFTVQVHMKVGTFNNPNSVVDVWFAHNGQPARLVEQAADTAIPNDGTGQVNKYGKIVLLPYNTGSTALINGAFWYDGLIVSTRRIPDPGVAIPNAPDSFSLSNISANSITANWRGNSQNGTAQDDTGFLIERCAGTPATCFPAPQSGFAQIGTTAAGASSFTDNTVANGTTYTYRVRAKNAAGNSSYAAAICFNGGTTCGGTATTSGTAPPPPPSFSACDVNKDGVTNVVDVQLEVNMALGISSCTNPSGTCTVVSVQRVVNAALGGTCVNP